jgi:Tfp pilus assembly protein PilV
MTPAISSPAPVGRRRPQPRAFTLLEVALAMFVLALAITTAITTMQRAFANLDTARNISTASIILQTEMEKERLLDWDSVRSERYVPALNATLQNNPAVAGRFTLSRTVTVLADRSSQMVQVTLTVRWRNADGRSLARSFTTYFTQNGLRDFFYSQS